MIFRNTTTVTNFEKSSNEKPKVKQPNFLIYFQFSKTNVLVYDEPFYQSM